MIGQGIYVKILLSVYLVWANGTPIGHENDENSQDRILGHLRADSITTETNLLQATSASVFPCSFTGICKTYFEFCDHQNRRCQKCEDYLYTCESRNVPVPVNCTNFCVDYLVRKRLDEYLKATSSRTTMRTSMISLITTETGREGFIAGCQSAFPDVVHVVLIVGHVVWICIIIIQHLKCCRRSKKTQSRGNSKEFLPGDVILKPLIGNDSLPSTDDNQGMMSSALPNEDSGAETIPKRQKSTNRCKPSRVGENPNHLEENKDSNNKDNNRVDKDVSPHVPVLLSDTRPNSNQDLRPAATASVHINITVAPISDMKENAQQPYPQEIPKLSVQEQGEVNNNPPADCNNQKPVCDLDKSSKMLLPESSADLKEVET